MIGACLDAASLGRVRFAASPAYETVCWLAWTAAGGRHPLFGDPGPAARFALRDPDVAVAARLARGGLTGGYVPDFLTPKPDRPSSRRAFGIDGQVERVRATPVAAVHEQLRRLPPDPGRSWPVERLPGMVAAGLSRFWQLAMAEPWSRIGRLLRQDQDRRMTLAAAGGMGAMLSSLHPDVRWTGSVLQIDKPYDEQVAYVDAELVLVPSLLAGSRLAVQVCDPADASLAYPVTATTTEPATRPEALLGRGRAVVLQAARRPATTTELSRRLGLAPATVSRHLHILLGAGLVTRTRTGHHVLYAQTPAAARLLATLG